MARIVLTAGGTGGHVFPAEALAATLLERGHDLTLVTDARGAEYGGVLGQLKTVRVRAGQVAGRGRLGQMAGLFDILRGAWEARRILAGMNPAVVVGFGGYASIPAMAAASMLHLPTIIHEQNGVLGRANRMLAKKVTAVATSFEDVRRLPPGVAHERVGMPVRQAIVDVRDTPYPDTGPDARLRVLVLGGSQGARVLSDIVPGALAALPEGLRRRLEVTQQCRPEDLDRVRGAYDEADLGHVALSDFFSDVPQRLAEAHLVIARAGASTVAEAMVVGRPAILVPLPHAIDDHQTANAQALDAAGGGWLIPQDRFTVELLAARLTDLFEMPATLRAAAGAARAVGVPDAAARLADLVEATMRKPAGGAGAAEAETTEKTVTKETAQ
ncbi:pyrophosphoryl-undecaprenol N-acetylglucosamine transferase [Caenispirillum salinarum AK4]|uniref:UDP-N-acetylglucosamine--N-acetylmuramyl-(pentapeptide) pyrophosphoryl-undecaprenol N-acetylglucosamine transferase n=1 Tax=Caenispirillum salinarum AK4 TaxID=1238182 RepID=K9GXJ9_9PROT|nr:undecaprenyldiphospho-muramoylpentapeptide beta-N-acetylglucosaminyltransferase [Caenispirillum salinarum]EKV29992.1 pyrophosphoryl-undecaprenol N-acetylglucosamine transferase [Caenispirillum salinarum AK4]